MKKIIYLFVLILLANSVLAQECTDGEKQACGPDTDEGVCKFGVQTCSNGAWGLCLGAVYSSEEIKDGLDNDCDSEIDEGFECTTGETRQCGENNIGACKFGIETCEEGKWSGVCEGGVFPIDEICGEGIDNDCDSEIDEGCEIKGDSATCFNNLKDENELGVDCGGSCSLSCRVCSEGEITQECLCDNELHSTGFCCSEKFQETKCKIIAVTIPTDTDGISDGQDNFLLCGNNVCNKMQGENETTCPKDCTEPFKVPWYLYLFVFLLLISAIWFFIKMLKSPKKVVKVPVLERKPTKVYIKEKRTRIRPSRVERELGKIK